MKSLKIIVAAALAASMLVGCGSTSDDKAIYNFSSEADVTSLDSSVSDDGVSFNAIHAFSEGLMDITAKGGTKLVPAAASSYKTEKKPYSFLFLTVPFLTDTLQFFEIPSDFFWYICC